MRANLDAQRGYVLSEPVMRALATKVGKHVAHENVYAAAMAGLEAGVDLEQALRTAGVIGPQGLSEAEAARALDPANALGSATAFVDRVLSASSAQAQAHA